MVYFLNLGLLLRNALAMLHLMRVEVFVITLNRLRCHVGSHTHRLVVRHRVKFQYHVIILYHPYTIQSMISVTPLNRRFNKNEDR